MIRYGDETWNELSFTGFRPSAEKRDRQWVDVELRVKTAEETPLPTDLIDFSILVVCTHAGFPMQIAPQDEGCDCEYQLTAEEKRQIEAYIATEPVQALIRQAANE
ncbi:hypothetical protein [Cohnella caldifontis]|uniref:hypothetical protein n=1 Tax=Cohnella caldifontis TaxID=3027471 RepID=UPI0023EE0898|nr:hypothetical protein [Cohnella sp. YIM B05605]